MATEALATAWSGATGGVALSEGGATATGAGEVIAGSASVSAGALRLRAVVDATDATGPVVALLAATVQAPRGGALTISGESVTVQAGRIAVLEMTATCGAGPATMRVRVGSVGGGRAVLRDAAWEQASQSDTPTPEYLTRPGQGVRPGTDRAYPGWGRTALATHTVHSPGGWVWGRVTGEEALQAQARRQAQQQAVTAQIAQQAAASQGPASLSDLAAGTLSPQVAQQVAAQIGRYLRVETGSLVVSGRASIDEAVIQEIWSRVVTAEKGVFRQVTSDMVEAGVVDGQVITGATVQTAKTGRRVVLDSQGLRLTGGDDAADVFSVDLATGKIKITGSMGMRDSWSETRFTDTTAWGADDEGPLSQQLYGVGLSFRRTDGRYRRPGLMVLREGPERIPEVAIQAPSLTDDIPGILAVGKNTLSFYSLGASMLVAPEAVNLSAGTAGLYASPQRGAITTRSDGIASMSVTPDRAYLCPSNWVNGSEFQQGFIAWSGATMMRYSRDQALWVDASGVHQSSPKNFAMWVPEMSVQRGGQMLSHASTESPHNGIEYWQNITLDADGRAEWVQADYLHLIASDTAPRIVLCSDGARGRLDTSVTPWRVLVEGEPGATVGVLLKLARRVEVHTEGWDWSCDWDPDYRHDHEEWITPPILPGGDMGVKTDGEE